MSLELWKGAARCKLPELFAEPPTERAVLAASALINILQYDGNHVQQTSHETDISSNMPDRTARYAEHAKNEFSGAEEYLEMYHETHDRDFLQMAYDENTHGEKFIKLLQKQGVEIGHLQEWMMDLKDRISKS